MPETKPMHQIVIETVCKFYGITEDDVKGNASKKEEDVLHRRICYYMLKTNTFYNNRKISELLGSNETTVKAAINRFKAFIEPPLSCNHLIRHHIKDIQLRIDNFNK